MLESIHNYFLNPKIKLSSKTIILLLILFGLVVADNFLNFTDHYNNQRKLEQIQLINVILNDSIVSESEANTLINLRKEIINHKTWKNKYENYLTSFNFIEKTNDDKPRERSFFWHFVSSSWLYILGFLGFFVGIISTKENRNLSSFIVLLLFIVPILLFLSWLSAKMLSYIPLIANNPNFNYGMNAILSVIPWILLAVLVNNQKKKI